MALTLPITNAEHKGVISKLKVKTNIGATTLDKRLTHLFILSIDRARTVMMLCIDRARAVMILCIDRARAVMMLCIDRARQSRSWLVAFEGAILRVISF